MLKLYHASLTRSVRILWLLEELGIPYELETVAFVPPTTSPFSQATPTGKFPALQDGDVTIFESGAILEYIIERYANGRLAPAVGSPLRGPYLQWVHFSEATAFPPLGELAFQMIFKPESERIPSVMEESRKRALVALGVLDKALAGKDYLLGRELSGADIMMGYTLQVAKLLGVLGDQLPNVERYMARLLERPGFQKALA